MLRLALAASAGNLRGMHIVYKLALASCQLFALAVPAHAEQTLIYPRPESDSDVRSQYPLQLLELALGKSGKTYQLQASKLKMLQNRALLQLANGGIDVYWSMTSKQREQELLPIRFAIDKGLLGWRVFLIRQNMQGRFAQVKTVEDLRQLNAVQGHDWPDTTILQANHLPVSVNPNYEFLFTMLVSGQADYFPRAITEVWQEAKSHAQAGLAIEQQLLLHYPTAMYYFVNKGNKVLAADIERGLLLAQKDGSFEKLFMQFYGSALSQANLQHRRQLNLHNPLAPADMSASLPDLAH